MIEEVYAVLERSFAAAQSSGCSVPQGQTIGCPS